VLATITPEEVSRVAREYFTPQNRTVAVLRTFGTGEAK
jgi:predicted Zn-dependent peptidase